MSAGDGKPSLKQLSPQEWESLIDSSSGAAARDHSAATLLDLAIPQLSDATSPSQPRSPSSCTSNPPSLPSSPNRIPPRVPASSTSSASSSNPLTRFWFSSIGLMLGTLRKYFSCIPDYRHFPGLKIGIPCYLRFDSEPFRHIWGFPFSIGCDSEGIEALPAIYDTVLKFSSTAPYGSIPLSRIPFLLGEPSRKTDTLVQRPGLDINPMENGSSMDDRYKAPVSVELEPREPTLGIVDVLLDTNAESGQIICGQLHSIPVAIEDMFLNAIIPSDTPEDEVPCYRTKLFSSLWEACYSSSDFGREIFSLKGGKAVSAIHGTRSVKLLDAPVSSVIESTECHLSSFVVCVIGEPLINIVNDDGIISGTEFKDIDKANQPDSNLESCPLRLTYTGEEDSGDGTAFGRGYMGCLHILTFLPPMFHLLLQMEVHDYSTLVRIRTDHWPCLAYIDD